MVRLSVTLHGKDVTELALESGREYVFGRAEGCDVQLTEQTGISRKHFRVYQDGPEWKVQVLAKFGDLIYAGSPVTDLTLEPGVAFNVAGYVFKYQTQEAEVSSANNSVVRVDENAQSEAVGQSQSLPATSSDDSQGAALAIASRNFEGNDEATRITATTSGVPFLRLIRRDGHEEILKLEGRKWIAGREPTCELILNDRKASRRQFELISSPQGYFIRDLGSSNGTILNNGNLAPDELKPICSGDVIRVGALSIYFEIRDPQFEKKLLAVPAEAMAPPQIPTPVVSHPQSYEIINFPVATGPGGAVRIDPNQQALQDFNRIHEREVLDARARTKKMRFYIVAGAALLLLVYFLSGDKTPDVKATAASNPIADAYGRLTPQKQQQVKETYILARNLFMQGKHALASDQLAILHSIIPQGYENSLAIAEECRAQAEQERNLQALQVQQAQMAENRRVVDQNLRDCERVANTTWNEDELRQCLSPSLDRDPGNAKIAEYLSRVQKRNEVKQIKQVDQNHYADQVAKGHALYARAEAVQKSGDEFAAVEAYKKHLQSSYPDPANLKARSRKAIEAINSRFSRDIQKSLDAAQADLIAQNYRGAIDEIKKAKAIDPQNVMAAEINLKVRRELNLKLREIYEGAIINEGLGKLDQAKTDWKRILEIDHPEGDYFKKAHNKLRAYGGI